LAASQKSVPAAGKHEGDGDGPEHRLFGIFVTYTVAFEGDMARGLAEQFLALAEKQDAIAPRLEHCDAAVEVVKLAHDASPARRARSLFLLTREEGITASVKSRN
jgi:hypothetical protein